MTAFLAILQYMVAAAFLMLGLSATVEALRHRERVRTYLALSLVLFSLVPVIGRVQAADGMPSVVLQYTAVLAFLGSGYGILGFRTCFLP